MQESSDHLGVKRRRRDEDRLPIHFTNENGLILYTDTSPSTKRICGVSRPHTTLPPWVAAGRPLARPYTNKLWYIRLNEELKDFVQWTKLSKVEKEARRTMIKDIIASCKSLYPSCTPRVFGSFASSLSTYFSDVDFCVIHPDYHLYQPIPEAVVRRLSSQLFQSGTADKSVAITNTRVPIVKGRAAFSDIKFDIGFNALNGLDQIQLAISLAKRHKPYFRPLILILKSFLRCRELDEPFTGGMGGYVLLQLVSAYFTSRHTIYTYPINDEWGTAQVFLEFLEFYGVYMDPGSVCINTSRKVPVMTRTEMLPYLSDPSVRQRHSKLAVLDPQNGRRNIGAGCFKYDDLRSCFEWAYWYLTSSGVGSHPTILSKVIQPDKSGMQVRENCIKMASTLKAKEEECTAMLARAWEGNHPDSVSDVISISSSGPPDPDLVTSQGCIELTEGKDVMPYLYGMDVDTQQCEEEADVRLVPVPLGVVEVGEQEKEEEEVVFSD